ncbi:hypothetical protein F5887DRAFT_824769, partial [Amanita rubescens]
EQSFCHQCRRRTYYLKMTCGCGKLYCNRCISTRYDNLPFNESEPDWTCPACHNSCSCDYCTKRRGEVYISLRVPKIKRDTSEQVVTRGEDEVELPASENQAQVIRVPKPLPPTHIVGIPGSYWGNVYSLTGEKIGTAMVAEGNQAVTLDCSISALLPAPAVAPLRKRVFAGRMQPCWG